MSAGTAGGVVSDSGIWVEVKDQFDTDGVAIYIWIRTDNVLSVARVLDSGRLGFYPSEGISEPQPSIRITDDNAKAIMEALMRHYRVIQQAGHRAMSDTYEIYTREDILQERKRVDKLIDVVSEIAVQSTQPE